MATKRRKRGRWWTVGAYAVVVLIFAVIPTGTALATNHSDKVAHLCEYAGFGWLLVQAQRAHRLPKAKDLWWAWMVATGYGALMELLQVMIPWRSAEVGDALANAVGAAVGVWLGT